jgi:hypothetical protein
MNPTPLHTSEFWIGFVAGFSLYVVLMIVLQTVYG